MTKVVFFADNSRLCGFEISGHSSVSETDTEGKILCSAISSAAYMTANTISEIIGDSIDADVKDGYMKIFVKNASEASQKVLEGFSLHISELKKQNETRITTYTEV